MVHLEYHDGWHCLGSLAVNPNAKTLKEKLKGSYEPKKPTLKVRFKILHSPSIKLNAVVLFAGLWLLWLSAANTPFEINILGILGFHNLE